MDEQKNSPTWLEFTRDPEGRYGVRGAGEEGVMLAALVGTVIVLFGGAGLLFGLRDWPLALLGVAVIAGMTYLTKLKFEHVQARRMKELDLAMQRALAQADPGSEAAHAGSV